MIKKFEQLLNSIQRVVVVEAIKRALVTLIPLLLIGSFAQVFLSLPIEGYQNFINDWFGGLLYKLFSNVYNVTTGMISIYMAGTVSYHIGVLGNEHEEHEPYDTVLVSIAAFLIMSGMDGYVLDSFGPKGMFVAILTACIASKVFQKSKRLVKQRILLADGADINVGHAIQIILPTLIVLLVFELISFIMIRIFMVDSVYELFKNSVNMLFENIGNGMISGVIYVLLSSILWFFGIHGGNVLEDAAVKLFDGATEVNVALVQSGYHATEIFTREFIDCFVLMGGCGTALSLWIALFLFSKKNSSYNLTRISFVPMVFNINEILVFGLPIIYNPIFFVPFLLAPLICFFTTYLAMDVGWVPMVINEVEWTTPIFLSGYIATESIAGALLQVVNLAIGVVIYMPFVLLYDLQKIKKTRKDYDTIVQLMKDSESARTPINFTDTTAPYGWMAKALAADIPRALQSGDMRLYYQPQYHSDGHCIGAEALLYWDHPEIGKIYPPLVFKLAEEIGFLEKLEEWGVRKAIADAKVLKRRYPDKTLKISVNITGVVVQSKSFEHFLEQTAKMDKIRDLHICLEITEQAVLQVDDQLKGRLQRIREWGYLLAIDDFSMGSTSVQYLTGNYFNLLKIDGSLVMGIIDNPRCCEIISSIVQLADSLDVDVLAEYVTNKEIRDKLLEVGCHLYQGWYYSPTLTLQDFSEKLAEE